ncbi:MAG: translation initiation factor IF-2 subunit gamma [Candidatus Micrarchaeota archaeon]|nr:translation initiation factor IF-2 subunit gamma [Candidatus Micrarchaeota archaeon]
MQAEVNIGLLGHVDHGKTTLTKALTGKWTDTHSEEIKRGISIRLGYADANVYQCKKCSKFILKDKCDCGGAGELKRRVSFVDAPGHETLMTTVISASSILDGALFLIAANETCPMPQTAEHLIVLNLIGIKKVVVVQTKIDLVTKEKAQENYKQIREFLKGSVAENAPIVPVAANYNINIDRLVETIEKTITTPKRDLDKPLRMYISRSFDINKPGTVIAKLLGGVIGGSITQGSLKPGDELELRPGIPKKEGAKPIPILFTANELREEGDILKEAMPGGLVAVGTSIDPAITKSDSLVGSVIGKVGQLDEVVDTLKLKYELLKRTDIENPLLKNGEVLVVNINTATSVGVITNLSKGTATVKLKKQIVADKHSKVAISRRLGQRWRLSGWASIV